MERKLRMLDSFAARGSDGATYKVRAYEHLVRDESLTDGREHWEPTGLAEYRLEDGCAPPPFGSRTASPPTTRSSCSRASSSVRWCSPGSGDDISAAGRSNEC